MESSNSSVNVEQARYQVPQKDIVINGANIVCSYCSVGQKPYHLYVPSCHGIMENGNNCAHDAHCVPFENIQPFSYCMSPYVDKVLKAVSQKEVTPAQKELFHAASLAVSANKSNDYRAPLPCILTLLDRWFEADEKDTLNDVMQFGTEIGLELHALFKKIVSYLNGSIRQNHLSYLYIDTENKFYKAEKKQIEAKEYIEKLDKDIMQNFSTAYEAEDRKFSGVVTELNHVKDSLEQIITYMKDEYLSSNFMFGDTRIAELEQEIADIDKMVVKIEGWKEKEYHLITTHSFLVCKCGGIITFKSSGQEYKDISENLMSSLLTTITEFKEYCRQGMVDYCLKEFDYVDHEWSSYKAAAEGMEDLERMVLREIDENGAQNEKETIETSDTDAHIYIELICKSYNDEIKKATMSLLALLSLRSKVLSLIVAAYGIGTLEDNAQGAIDGISANISALESLPGENTGVITQLGGANIVKINNFYTILSSIVGFLYVSYNTSIQNIKITVFTKTHAHVCERVLNEVGMLEKGMYAQMYTKTDYISGGLGRGLQWMDDPGVYMRRLVHKGDNRNAVERKYGKEGDIQDETIPK